MMIMFQYKQRLTHNTKTLFKLFQKLLLQSIFIPTRCKKFLMLKSGEPFLCWLTSCVSVFVIQYLPISFRTYPRQVRRVVRKMLFCMIEHEMYMYNTMIPIIQCKHLQTTNQYCCMFDIHSTYALVGAKIILLFESSRRTLKLLSFIDNFFDNCNTSCYNFTNHQKLTFFLKIIN